LDKTIATLKMAADLRVSANRARRLALQMSSVVDQNRLCGYATELEKRAMALEKRAAPWRGGRPARHPSGTGRKSD
jgi:hypothetical protein